jgi:cytochrome b561
VTVAAFKPTTVKRYHPALVVLHWLIALLVLVGLVLGSFSLSTLPNSSPDKIGALRGHMIAGGAVLILTLIRMIVRRLTAHPPPASTGFAVADRLAPLAHAALYLAVLAMAGSGIAMSISANLPAIVFGGQGSLPLDFSHLPARSVHGFAAKLLLALVTLHVAAALYHQVMRRDGLLARMTFGSRAGPGNKG